MSGKNQDSKTGATAAPVKEQAAKASPAPAKAPAKAPVEEKTEEAPPLKRYLVTAECGIFVGRHKYEKGEVLPPLSAGGILNAAIHFKQVKVATAAEVKAAAVAAAKKASEAAEEITRGKTARADDDPGVPGE